MVILANIRVQSSTNHIDGDERNDWTEKVA